MQKVPNNLPVFPSWVYFQVYSAPCMQRHLDDWIFNKSDHHLLTPMSPLFIGRVPFLSNFIPLSWRRLSIHECVFIPSPKFCSWRVSPCYIWVFLVELLLQLTVDILVLRKTDWDCHFLLSRRSRVRKAFIFAQLSNNSNSKSCNEQTGKLLTSMFWVVSVLNWYCTLNHLFCVLIKRLCILRI